MDLPLGRLSLPLRLAAAGLGLVLVAGAFLHPDVPQGMAAQASAMTTARWESAHWVLTLAQLAAAGACLGFLVARRPGAASGVGLGLLAVGATLGSLGTLGAATMLPEAGRQGDLGLFGVLAKLDLGVGWLCLMSCALGAALAGTGLAHRSQGKERALWVLVAVGGLALAVVGAFIRYDAHAMHNVVLRVGAGTLGLGFLLASWLVPTET